MLFSRILLLLFHSFFFFSLFIFVAYDCHSFDFIIIIHIFLFISTIILLIRLRNKWNKWKFFAFYTLSYDWCAIKRAQFTRLSSISFMNWARTRVCLCMIIDQSAFIYRNPKSKHYYMLNDWRKSMTGSMSNAWSSECI